MEIHLLPLGCLEIVGLQIRRFIRFNLDDIRKQIIGQFKNNWIPFPEVAVDETLLLFKGRFRFKQHITEGNPIPLE